MLVLSDLVQAVLSQRSLFDCLTHFSTSETEQDTSYIPISHTLSPFLTAPLTAFFTLFSGLDLPVVDLVINYDLPRQTETYVHRIGRTARAGKSGVAITIVTPENVKKLSQIEKAFKTKLVQHATKEVPKRKKQLRAEWSAEEKAKYEQEYLLDVVMKNMSKVDTVFQIVKLNAETEEQQKERDLGKEQKEEAKLNAKAQKRMKAHSSRKQSAKRVKK